MKFLPLVLMIKILAFALGGAAVQQYFSGDTLHQSAALGKDEQPSPVKNSSSADSAVQSSRFLSLEDVPNIPEGGAGYGDFSRIRAQLQLMKQEVEEKIVRLKLAAEAYQEVKEESDQKLRQINEERKLLEESLIKEKEVQKERVDEALAFVEKMEPKKAAPMFEAMDRDLVIALFKKLKPRTVTTFLEAMRPDKATEYMEYYTKIRSGREYELLRDMRMCQGADFGDEEMGAKKEK